LPSSYSAAAAGQVSFAAVAAIDKSRETEPPAPTPNTTPAAPVSSTAAGNSSTAGTTSTAGTPPGPSPSPSLGPGQWQCMACTFINEAEDSSECRICLTARPKSNDWEFIPTGQSKKHRNKQPEVPPAEPLAPIAGSVPPASGMLYIKPKLPKTLLCTDTSYFACLVKKAAPKAPLNPIPNSSGKKSNANLPSPLMNPPPASTKKGATPANSTTTPATSSGSAKEPIGPAPTPTPTPTPATALPGGATSKLPHFPPLSTPAAPAPIPVTAPAPELQAPLNPLDDPVNNDPREYEALFPPLGPQNAKVAGAPKKAGTMKYRPSLPNGLLGPIEPVRHFYCLVQVRC